jgi:hypothetical protein
MLKCALCLVVCTAWWSDRDSVSIWSPAINVGTLKIPFNTGYYTKQTDTKTAPRNTTAIKFTFHSNLRCSCTYLLWPEHWKLRGQVHFHLALDTMFHMPISHFAQQVTHKTFVKFIPLQYVLPLSSTSKSLSIHSNLTLHIPYITFLEKDAGTRWFKYDRDDLCVNKSQFVPVIFEPPCTFQEMRRIK